MSDVHQFFCDNCCLGSGSRALVRGVRYRCSVCADFDLCEICLLTNEQRGDIHDASHLFLRIAKPLLATAPLLLSSPHPPLPPPTPPVAVPEPGHEGTHELAFGDVLHKVLRAQQSDGKLNLFFSPMSVSFCWFLVANGARGKTLEEIVNSFKVAHFPSLQALNDDSRNLILALTASSTISVANSVWVSNPHLQFNQSFVETLSNYYCATAEFFSSVQQVNDWVEKNTRGKIKEILSPRAPPPEVVLVNAIYFKDSWSKPFSASATKPKQFARPTQAPMTVNMMHMKDHFKHVDCGTYQAVLLPYEGPLCAVVILPAAGLSCSTVPPFAHIFQQLSAAEFQLGVIELPKFKCTAEYGLNQVLQNMGVRAAFNSGYQLASRDFDPMLAPPATTPFVVHLCVHKVFVEVDEKGTEAAAVTAVAMVFGCAHPPPTPAFQIVCDRPFLFFIATKPTGRTHIGFTSASTTPSSLSVPPGRVIFQGEINEPSPATPAPAPAAAPQASAFFFGGQPRTGLTFAINPNTANR